jgi:S-adenosylmethionine:tRNA ribosyltransferase-isomerase
MTPLLTSDFDYQLPREYIAQSPLEPRDSSRLMVLYRENGRIEHRHFDDLGEYLERGDVLVVNESKVILARIYAKKIPTGGKVEILLLKRISGDTWEALVGGKGSVEGSRYQILSKSGLITSIHAEVVSLFDGPRRFVRFDQPIEFALDEVGHVPLPPYIHSRLRDLERYQTVYARSAGSAAAPTAGLHFTSRLMDSLQGKGIQFVRVTLHIGLDTFAPVTEDNPVEHKIHSEWCQVTSQASDSINQARKNGSQWLQLVRPRCVQSKAQHNRVK